MKSQGIQYLTAFVFLASFFSVGTSLWAQEKSIVQIKTFDQQHQPFPNLTLSLNGKEFISIGNKGIAFIEMLESELPPKSIKIKGSNAEAVSWNYSNKVLEVIIKESHFTPATISVKNGKNEALPNLKIKFYGKKTFSTTTNAQGIFEVPQSVSEQISEKDQFKIKGYRIVRLLIEGKDKTIIAESLKNPVDASKVAQEKTVADDRYFKDFDIKKIDSIHSLTVFYAVFKNYKIETLDEKTKQSINAKFNELVKQLGDSTAIRKPVLFIGSISDSSLVSDDVQSLLAAAEEENKLLDAMRDEIDVKTQIMINKLERNKEVLDSSARGSLLEDINELETILGQNERKFYKNQSNYDLILRSLKERLFDMKDLENKLLMSESQRLEEQKAFRQKMLIVFLISLALGLLTLGSLYFGSKLRKQKKELIKANAEVERVNEGLENLVYQRTKSLEDANHEMDIFLYKASHDLRSPISTIMGLCHVAKLSKTEGMDIFEKVFHTANSMDKMLIKLHFITEINHPSNYSLISFSNKMEGVRREYEAFIKDNAISFTTDFPKDLSFYSYPILVDTILDNLVDNALFYSSLKKQATREVHVKAVRENDHVEISVYDNGIGIDPAIRERLWEMFFVGNEDSTGNGIGLYIVKKSVEVLKGHISFESEQYVFTRFVVTIPIDNASP